jgi:hypothetical protein
MKYVQVLILAFFAATAVMLFDIYRSPRVSEAVPELAVEAIPPSQEIAPAAVVPEITAPALEPVTPEPPKPKPTRKQTARKPAPATTVRVEPEPPVQPAPPVLETAPSPSEGIEIAGLEPKESAPPAPAEPRRVMLPAGTELSVRLSHSLSTERNLGGDTFYANLDHPIIIDDMVIAKKGARVEGRVLDVQRAGRVKGLSELSIELVRLDAADGQTLGVVTSKVHRQGDESKKEDAKKVGIAAGIGALVGAIAGGGKGAAIGAGVGAGAGGGAVAATRGEPVEIPSETRLTFRLLDPIGVVERL